MTIRRNLSALLCASAAASLLSACGSSNGGLSKSQLDAKVNAACSAYSAAAKRVAVPADFVTNPVSATAYLDKIKPLVHTEYNAIEALKASGSIKSEFETYLGDGKHQLALFDQVVAKAHARDRTGLGDLQTMVAYKQITLAPLDRQLGFTACVGSG